MDGDLTIGDDNILAGHATLAVPAIYGETGVMCFLAGETGRILQADLGARTPDIVQGIALSDSDARRTPIDE